MRRISSKGTFFKKWVFPTVWFGILIVIVGTSIFTSAQHNSAPPFPFFIVPAIMAVGGFFIMKKMLFDLVDEVWEDGDSLIVKNRGQEQRIALSDIKNVSYSPYMNPPRVTLSLRRPTVFGEQITFAAPVRYIPFATSPLINDLIDRIDAARQQQR